MRTSRLGLWPLSLEMNCVPTAAAKVFAFAFDRFALLSLSFCFVSAWRVLVGVAFLLYRGLLGLDLIALTVFVSLIILICLFLMRADDVTWGSTDFGTMVCIQCSGHHRNFSLPVRSITLDRWSPAQIEV